MRPVHLCILLVCGSAIPASAQQLKEITNSIGMKMVLILPGSFRMGSPIAEIGRNEDETPHIVTISNWYYLGVYEVTQGEYEKVMNNNPSSFKGVKNPVETVSWDDAVSFCKKLSEMPQEKAAGREYRLPTEAEWEYSCRAGSNTSYSFGETAESLEEYGWFGEGREGKTHLVGLKKPNRWGLYDMQGNVWERCTEYPPGAATNPSGPWRGEPFVFRGGSWSGPAEVCRSTYRLTFGHSVRSSNIGFRVAMSLPVKNPESASSK